MDNQQFPEVFRLDLLWMLVHLQACRHRSFIWLMLLRLCHNLFPILLFLKISKQEDEADVVNYVRPVAFPFCDFFFVRIFLYQIVNIQNIFLVYFILLFSLTTSAHTLNSDPRLIYNLSGATENLRLYEMEILQKISIFFRDNMNW